MKKKIEFLALLSSDQRPKYLEDIYACMAMPKSSSYRFRYDARYLPPEVLEVLSDEYDQAFEALICFRGKFNKSSEAIVPVRWVTVTKVRRVLDFYVFYFDFGDYPSFNDQFKNQSGTALAGSTKEYLSQIPQGLRGFPVLSARMGFVSNVADSESDTWLKIVRTLSMHPSFDGLHFLRVPDLNGVMSLEKRGGQTIFSVPSGQYLNLNLEYYSETFSADEILQISADETIVRFANGRSHRLSSRYDLLSLLIESKRVEDDAELDLHFSVKRTDEARQFGFLLPIRITKPRFQFLWRMIVPTVGGLLLASRSFLGPGVSPAFVGVLIVVGALLIGAGVARKR